MYSSPMQLPWFAIAFALYPLLYIAAANPGQVGQHARNRAVAGTAASTILLVALRFLLGNWLRAGLGVAWCLVLFSATAR